VSTFTVQLPDSKADLLTQEADRRGVRVEDLLVQLADDFLSRREAVDAASRYVLTKNAELYRRLAK
jgi:hypothetical protein